MVTRDGSRTLFGALVLSLALLLPVALIAADGTQAAKKTFKIRKGNAKPAWDIVGLQVNNAKKKLRVKVQFRGKPASPAAEGHTQRSSIDLNFGKRLKRNAPHYYLRFDRGVEGKELRLLDYARSSYIACPGLRAAVRKKAVVFVVPRKKCLRGAADRVRVRAFTQSFSNAKREVDHTGWRKWVKRG